MTFTFPEWDRVEPIDIYKWRRAREAKRFFTSQMPMMQRVRDDGTPLYRMTASGGWARTKPLYKSRRAAVIERDGACVKCGSGGPFEVDHIVRYVDGGSNEMENLRTLCYPCHRSRGGRA